MPTSDNTPLLSDASYDGALMVPPSQPVEFAPAGPAKGAQLMTYVHALRRRWLMATVAGLLCAGMVGPAIWYFRGSRYEATASIQVLPSDQNIVFDEKNRAVLPNDYEIYRDTQVGKIKDRVVLTAALRPGTWDKQPELGLDALPNDQKGQLKDFNQRQGLQAVNWLMDSLNAAPAVRNGQVVRVGLQAQDATASAALVNAVVRAYMTEVVWVELKKRRSRLDQLEKMCDTKGEELRDRWNKLRAEAEQLGTADPDALSVKQQWAQQLYAEYQRELLRLRLDQERAKGQLKANQQQVATIRDMEVPEYDLAMLMNQDPAIRDLLPQLNFYRMVYAQNKQNVAPGAVLEELKRNERQLASVQGQYDAITAELRERVRGQKRSELDKEIRKLASDLSVLEEQMPKFEEDVKKAGAEADRLGKRSTAVEMARADVKQFQQILETMTQERERLKVEEKSRPRVEIFGDPSTPAEVPLVQSGRTTRFALTVLGVLVSLCLPVIGIAVWEVRSGRINTAEEVSTGLGVRVLGSLPLIPAGVIRQLGAPTRRNRQWRMRLDESVDALTARLLRHAETEGKRVILISSAAPGEGKTTLATQIAMSLARNLRRTVLVDFDLRRPALDGVFSLPLENGVCEALRGQGDVSGMVHRTGTEHLSVVTAGRWDRQTMAALANGSVGPLLDQLRAQFDFVILDTSPILPVADTRFVSQKADSVVLSVFRDKSQGPQILAACDILEAFGVRTVAAAVTGGGGTAYGSGIDYEPTASLTLAPAADEDPSGGQADAQTSTDTGSV